MWRTPFGSAASDHIAATQAQLLGAPIHNLLVIHLTSVHLRNGMLGLQRTTPTNIVPIGARDVRTFSYDSWLGNMIHCYIGTWRTLEDVGFGERVMKCRLGIDRSGVAMEGGTSDGIWCG
jgi:hypothetical protein